MAVSILQARREPSIVRRSLQLDGAAVELCAYPEVREERLRIVEPEAILMLGLSRLLSGAEGRLAGDPRRPFTRVGGLVLRPAGIPLEFRVGQGAFDTIRIRFSAERIAPVFGSEPLQAGTLAACLDLRAPPVEEAMLRLADELDHPAPDTPAVATALVTLIQLDLARRLEEARSRTQRRMGGLSARALRTALDLVGLAENAPSIDAMAQQCGLSRHHFIRCFRESAGTGPGAAVRRAIIARAKVLLTEGRPVAEVAAQLGYANTPSFTTAFRRETGRPPGAWKAQIR